MPTLLLKVTPLQNPERYQALAAALDALTGESAPADPGEFEWRTVPLAGEPALRVGQLPRLQLEIAEGASESQNTPIQIADTSLLQNIDPGETLVVGYYTQIPFDFRPEQRVIDTITEIAEVIPYGKNESLSPSQFLSKFLFPTAQQYTPVEKLSGGEKKRLQLMRVLVKNPNFLILDEPTNDLDLDTLQLLEDFLRIFQNLN